MFLKKLELFGFKSFADKTVLNFEKGVTAIVGPNGCGKSNIFDSIRWVLGEQSIKELRGSSMEDVIFNGTDKKPSLGFAEVSLTFSNDSKRLPVEYDDVTITRRLFRSGESEYLINKSVVRLKDIQEMFMGTGIGAEAYSLIQQGKVDLVVSARPEERRMIFDEASGITKYKSKKKEALNKLKDTENNLLRVNDIIVEVKRQIGSIERQANKARKYKTEFEKLKTLEVKSAKYQIDNYSYRMNEINRVVEELKSKQTELTNEYEEFSRVLTSEINFLGELDQKINNVREDEIKLDGKTDLNNRQIGFNQERIENLIQNNEKFNIQKQQLIERCQKHQEKIEDIKQLIEVTEKNIINNEETLNEKKNNLSTLERTIKETKDKIRDNEENILTLTSRQVNVRNELTDVMREIQGCLARKRRLEIEDQKVSFEKTEISQKLKYIESQINELQAVITQLVFFRGIKSQKLSEIRARLNNLDKVISELEKKILFLKSQKEFIEKLHTQYQDIPDPTVEGVLITSTPPSKHHTGILGKVKEVKTVDGKSLINLGCSFVDGDAQELYKIVCETKFIELDPQQVSARIDEINSEVKYLNSAKESIHQNLQKEMSLLHDLQQDIHEKEKSYFILDAQKKDILNEEKKLDGELQLVESELSEVKESFDQAKCSENELNYKLETINKEIIWSQDDIKEKQSKIAVTAQEKEETIVYIAQLEKEMESNKEKLENQRENENMFIQDLDNYLVEIKKIDNEIEQQTQRKDHYIQEIESLKTKIEEIKLDKENLKTILNDYNVQKTNLAEKVNTIRSSMTSVEEQLEALKQKLHDQQLKNQELSFDEKSIKDRLMQSYKINYDEVQIIPADQILESTEDQSTNDDSTSETGLIKVVIEEEINIEDLTLQIEKLRKRCDSFGSVNLVAIEEYEELKNRFEFLTKQQIDLIEAKSQLMNTIKKINRSTKQMFMDTFTKVGEEFRIYFRMLFGGGEAQLVLNDPENVLESGIDIIAKPPGKKLQNISLLSGGEKSLTAIALIFGVFKVNPSPFCVLDEIDAALDESNVGRFGYLLKDFSSIAQFIVITHNKKTISNANVMYGITMPETGISRIVSVKFSDETKREVPEAVPAGV